MVIAPPLLKFIQDQRRAMPNEYMCIDTMIARRFSGARVLLREARSAFYQSLCHEYETRRRGHYGKPRGSPALGGPRRRQERSAGVRQRLTARREEIAQEEKAGEPKRVGDLGRCWRARRGGGPQEAGQRQQSLTIRRA